MISRFSMWSQVHGGLCNNGTHPSSPGIAKVCSEVQTSWMLMHLFCFKVQVTQTDIQSWQDSWCVFHKRRVHNEVIQSGHLIKFFCPSCHLGCLLQSRQVKHTPKILLMNWLPTNRVRNRQRRQGWRVELWAQPSFQTNGSFQNQQIIYSQWSTLFVFCLFIYRYLFT